MWKRHTKSMARNRSAYSETGLLQILRPLAKFCLRRSLKIQEITEILKQALVESAHAELLEKGREATVSKLSVMTGLHRRDVMRLTSSEGEPKQAGSLVKKVLSVWERNKKYLDARGRPRALTFESLESEFASLVASISADISPYTLLYELERSKTIEKKGDKIKLVSSIYTAPRGDEKEGFRMLSGDIDDLISSVEDNIYSAQDIPHLHIKTSYDNIVESALPKIRRWVLDKGEEFHHSLREFIARYDKDLNPKLKDDIPGAKISVGTFSISRAANEEER